VPPAQKKKKKKKKKAHKRIKELHLEQQMMRDNCTARFHGDGNMKTWVASMDE
jgi:hypothetical protein